MSDILARICDDKRIDVARRRRERPLDALRPLVAEAPAVRGFARQLRKFLDSSRYGLIAEIKKASPSEGVIRAEFDPPALARAYQAGGAACLSVLTDTPYFQGEDSHLVAARAAVDLPVLRKDFVVDPYQVVEARTIGADCVLLIMAALGNDQARELEATAIELGMDVLLEVHDDAELERALALRSPLVGINNRDLRTLKTDVATTERLAPRVPADRVLVCESGLHRHSDLVRMSDVGARCFLVGTSLMRHADLATATRALLGGNTADRMAV